MLPGEDARRYVERLARDKARAVGAHRAPPVVLAADTTVALDGEIFAKPDDAAHAARMLAALSGRTHEVHTGVAVARAEGSESFVVTTEVTFAALTEAMIHWYVGTGEPSTRPAPTPSRAPGCVRRRHRRQLLQRGGPAPGGDAGRAGPRRGGGAGRRRWRFERAGAAALASRHAHG
ncbi:MAG: Maf family protein [Acidimicrobiales bacterium]